MTHLFISYCHLNAFDLRLFRWTCREYLHLCFPLNLTDITAPFWDSVKLHFKVWFQTTVDHFYHMVPFSVSLLWIVREDRKTWPCSLTYLIKKKGWAVDNSTFLKSVCDLSSGLCSSTLIAFSSPSSE